MADQLSAIELVRRKIDQGPITGMMVTVVAIGFMLNLVDGFDVVAMSVAGPSLSAEWGISDGEKGWVLSAALIGMAVGAAVLAPLCDIYGRRALILLSTAIIGLSMVATGMIPQSLLWLIILRAISGLGIGVIFASGATIAAEFTPERYRNLAVTAVVMGYPFGAMLVGPVAQWIIPRQGWEMLFVYGGLATLALGCVLYVLLPESPEFLANRQNRSRRDVITLNKILSDLGRSPIDDLPPEEKQNEQSGNVTALLSNQHRANTIATWAIYFLGFLSLYFLLSWIPSLFVDAGFSRKQGISALTQFNLGGVLGIILIGLITTRLKLARPIALFFLLSGLCLAALYLFRLEALFALNASVLIIGFLLQGAFTAMYAVAARIYPTNVRATGIGWAAGLGRTGAIVSPIAGGYLAGMGWDLYSLSLLFAFPLLVAGVLVLRYKV